MIKITIQLIPLSKLRKPKVYFRFTVDDKHVKELTESIAENGLKIPLLVKPDNDGTYEILDGYHRFLALKLLGYDKAPCIVIEMDYITALKRIYQIHENKVKFSVADKIHQIVTLARVYNKTPKEIGKILGLTERTIERYLFVWRMLDEEEKMMLAQGKISFRKALKLAQSKRKVVDKKYFCEMGRHFVDQAKPVFLCPQHYNMFKTYQAIRKLAPEKEVVLRRIAMFHSLVEDFAKLGLFDPDYESFFNFLLQAVLFFLT